MIPCCGFRVFRGHFYHRHSGLAAGEIRNPGMDYTHDGMDRRGFWIPARARSTRLAGMTKEGKPLTRHNDDMAKDTFRVFRGFRGHFHICHS